MFISYKQMSNKTATWYIFENHNSKIAGLLMLLVVSLN